MQAVDMNSPQSVADLRSKTQDSLTDLTTASIS